MPHLTEENKPVVHYGRGGAGNITTKSKESSNPVPETTPMLKSQHYTTGRGGTGNMAKNDDPAETRAAQDVEISDVPFFANAHHVGRGGAANQYAPNEQAQLNATADGKESRQQAGKSTSNLKDVADKASDPLTGRHQ